MQQTVRWTHRTSPSGACYVAPEPGAEGARIYFFTREGGVSQPPYDSLNASTKTGDNEGAVAENRWRIRSSWGGNESAWIKQVAGDGVVRVSEPGFAGEADALVTDEVGLPLTVLVADCVPVALVGERGVTMVHSGWRGAISGISGKAARDLGGNIKAYVGPSMRGCCYEVSEDLAARFADAFGPDVADGRMLHLPGAVRVDLERAGVTEVHDLGLCTGCRSDLFYSHRKEGPETGRNLAAVVRTEGVSG